MSTRPGLSHPARPRTIGRCSRRHYAAFEAALAYARGPLPAPRLKPMIGLYMFDYLTHHGLSPQPTAPAAACDRPASSSSHGCGDTVRVHTYPVPQSESTRGRSEAVFSPWM